MLLRFQPVRSLRLQTVLLIVNLAVLAVPLASLYLFRLYENELVQQTEQELIAQGAYISALLTAALDNAAGKPPSESAAKTLPGTDETAVIAPTLNLSWSPVLPERPDAMASAAPADPLVLAAAQRIFPIVEAATLTTLAGVRITDRNGIVIAGRGEAGQSLASIDEVAGALSGHYTARLRERVRNHPAPALDSISRSSAIRIFIGMPIRRDGAIIGSLLLSRSPRNVVKALYENRLVVGLAAIFILAVTALLGSVTSFAISRPIRLVTRQAERIASGQGQIGPIAHPVTREVEILSRTLAQMAAAVAHRSHYIRSFATHVSHEFKTPLTAIQGAIELIGEHGATMPAETRERFLTNIRGDTDRLRRLTERLLELAHADVLVGSGESCAVAPLLERLQSAYAGALLVERRAPGDAPDRLAIAPDIAETVFGNLLENSRQHGAGRVTITLDAASAGDTLILSFEDDGTGISPGNAENLFQPFFTTRRGAGGTGLGLAITRSLLAAYGGRIRHQPTRSGACFRIEIPAVAAADLASVKE